MLYESPCFSPGRICPAPFLQLHDDASYFMKFQIKFVIISINDLTSSDNQTSESLCTIYILYILNVYRPSTCMALFSPSLVRTITVSSSDDDQASRKKVVS